MSGSVSWDEQRATMGALRMTPPGIRVLFVTPEKVAASDNLMRLLDDLDGRGALVGSLITIASKSAPCLRTWHADSTGSAAGGRCNILQVPLAAGCNLD